MDIRECISELQKFKNINNQFQNKLGDITLQLNNSRIVENSPKDLVIIFIKVLQGFLCHKYYVDYVNQKSVQKFTSSNQIGTNPNFGNDLNESNNQNISQVQQSSIYDNSMNLILVISAKLSKDNINFAKSMVEMFTEHISNHSDCFNYIISFYRLYINCTQLKQASREYELSTYLFELYKKIYRISYKCEFVEYPHRINDLNNLRRMSSIKESNSEKRFFLDNFKHLLKVEMKDEISIERNTERTNNELSNFDNISKGSKIVPNTSEKINLKFNVFNSFKTSNTGKSITAISKTDRKNNKQLSGDFQNSTLLKGDIDVDIDKANILKKAIPQLKFAIGNTDNNYSHTKSSRRNEISKSGGGSTYHTGNNRIISHNSKIPSASNIIIKKDLLIDGSSSMNRQNENDQTVSPKHRLKTIALELGESCLAADLASLINQKRDLELGKIARNKASVKTTPVTTSAKRNTNYESDYIEKLRNNDKLEIDLKDEDHADSNKNTINSYSNNFNTNQNQLKNLLNKKPLIKSQIKEFNEVNNNNTISYNNILEFTKDFKRNFVFSIDNQIGVNLNTDKIYKNYIKIREILSNFLLSCLREYSIDEFNYININQNLVYSYFLLPSFDHIRRKLEKKKYEYIEYMPDCAKDLKSIYAEGAYNITDNKENLFKTIFLNSVDKSQTVNEDLLRNFRPNFATREKASFESFLSINFEEDRTTSLALKSEFDALYEILFLHSSNIEQVIKQQNFFKPIFYSLENPEPEAVEFWCKGILFTLFNKLNNEHVRKHVDIFLDRIKNRITFVLKTTNINNNQIWNVLKQQIDIISLYVSSSNSRIVPVHVVFEFSEILIILKKTFLDIFSKIGPFEVNKNEIIMIEKADYSEYQIPENLLELFTSYLELLSKIIVNAQIIICEKFLNSTFLLCSQFKEILKFVITYIFTKDLSAPEKSEVNKVNSNRKNSFAFSSKEKSSIKYTLINFIKEADIVGEISVNVNILKIYENYKDYLQMALFIIDYLHNATVFYHKIVRKENLDKQKNEHQEITKYWFTSIFGHLKFLNIFVNSKFGLFYDYLSKNGSYIKLNNNQLLMNTREKESLYNGLRTEKQNPIINCALTRALLNLQYSIFDFNNKFSIVLTEETSLDLIRIHYISFIKLYNKNLDFPTKIGEMGKLLENCNHNEKKKRIKALIRDIYNDQNHLNVIIYLCKLHLMCLFALAKNRNPDVTNKFYQLRIVDFLVKELDLEHESTEKIYKLKNNFASKDKIDYKNHEESLKFDEMNNVIGKIKLISLYILDKFNANKSINTKHNIKSLSLNLPVNDKKLKEEIIRKKYIPKQGTVVEVGEEDISKLSYKKRNSKSNNISQRSEFESFDTKKFNNLNFIDENEEIKEKNVIIENLEIEKSQEDQNEEGEGDELDYDSDLSDIMLVNIKPMLNPYEDKIPKLSLIPNTFADTALCGNQNIIKPNIKPKEKSDDVKDTNIYTSPSKINNLKSLSIAIAPSLTQSQTLFSNNNSALKPENVTIDFKDDNKVNNKELNEEKTNKFSIDLKHVPNRHSLNNPSIITNLTNLSKNNTEDEQKKTIINKCNIVIYIK